MLDAMQLQFTLPVALEDLASLADIVRKMPWSEKPLVDVYCHDGKTVCLNVRIGNDTLERRYDAG
jgi:hypothetical protein